MNPKRALPIVLACITLLLMVSISPGSSAVARSLSPNAPGVAIPYMGRLSSPSGEPPADGTYSFTFDLYNAQIGGTLLWSETQQDVAVKAGEFTTALGHANAIPTEALDGGKRWLAVGVRGPGESNFTALIPRQQLNPPSSGSTAAPVAGPSCAHNHLGEYWSGNTSSWGLQIFNSGAGGFGADTSFSGSIGVSGGATSSTGSGWGVRGYSYSPDGLGGYFYNDYGGGALKVAGTGDTPERSALRVDNSNTNYGIAAYLTNNSQYYTTYLKNTGSGGGVLHLQNSGTDASGTGGGVFIEAQNNNPASPILFRVDTAGGVWTLGGYHGAPDFAEMMATEKQASAYEPGDVLVISADSDRTVALSSTPYSTLVIGVYSTRPGFIGAQQMVTDQTGNNIPVAVVGIVPIKVSAENGPIQRGDLLVTSSTPGYAMKGTNLLRGTILGKALGTLDQGTGVIQAIVTLQ